MKNFLIYSSGLAFGFGRSGGYSGGDSIFSHRKINTLMIDDIML